MKWFFKRNSNTMILYWIIGLIIISLSLFGLFDDKYKLYPLFNATIGSIFGFLYLFTMLKSLPKNNQANGEKSIGKTLISNYIRFLIPLTDLIVCFLLTRFLPVEGIIDKRAYIYILVNLGPMISAIILFFVRTRNLNGN